MPTCFVIMPITTPPSVREAYRDDDHFAHVLEHLFTPALGAAGYEVWPPSATGSDLIQGEIIRQLDQADLVLCDMTSLNANVFFELGIRTALDKPVAMVKDRHTENIPFDVGSMSCHEYDGRMEAWTLPAQVDGLTAHVQACTSRDGTRNTLWKYFGIEAQARVGSAGTSDDDKLDYLVRQIEDLRNDVRPPLAWPPEILPAGRDLHIDPKMSAAVRRFLVAAWPPVVRAGGELVASQDPRTGTVVVDVGPSRLDGATVRALAEAAVVNEVKLEVMATDPDVRMLLKQVGCLAGRDAPAGRPIAWTPSRS